MSRFVRLVTDIYINLDLVIRVYIHQDYDTPDDDPDWILTFCFINPETVSGLGEIRLTLASEAEARAELARILPESVQPTSNRFPGIAGDGSNPLTIDRDCGVSSSIATNTGMAGHCMDNLKSPLIFSSGKSCVGCRKLERLYHNTESVLN